MLYDAGIRGRDCTIRQPVGPGKLRCSAITRYAHQLWHARYIGKNRLPEKSEVGMNFAEAIQLARKSGYAEYCPFRQRKREAVRF